MQALHSGLEKFIDPTDPLAARLLQEHETHEVFTLGLQHIGDLKDQVANHKSIGWRFLAAHPASDLACHVGGPGPRVTGLARGPQVRSILNYIAYLDTLVRLSPECKPVWEGEYQLRVLRIPALFVEALWLSSPIDPTADLIIPCAGFVESAKPNAAYKLQMMQPYPAKVFFDSVRAAANYRLDRQRKLYPEDYA